MPKSHIPSSPRRQPRSTNRRSGNKRIVDLTKKGVRITKRGHK